MPQDILKSQSTAGFRRVPFIAVDKDAPQTRLRWSDMGIGAGGSFTIKISKNGTAPATPAGTTITEIDSAHIAAIANGAGYWQGNAADFDTPGFLLLWIGSSGGAKIMEPREIHIEVNEVDAKNAIRGMAGTALPNVAAGGAGGIFIRGTGAGEINQSSNGTIDVNVVGGAFLDTLQDIVGLLHENSMIDNVSYADGNLIVSARKRQFADQTALNAASPGSPNGTDGEIARWTVTAVDGGSGQFTSWKQERTL